MAAVNVYLDAVLKSRLEDAGLNLSALARAAWLAALVQAALRDDLVLEGVGL